MGCHPECYTKGRGCIMSQDGQCVVVFGQQRNYVVKDYQKDLIDFMRGKKVGNIKYDRIKKPLK